jgi:uncharacterized membrane protein YphA (DoxX/SURF4 family)
VNAAAGMRAPERWIALLRVVVGAWFAKSIITKISFSLVWGVLPFPGASARWLAAMPKLLAKYAAENPFPIYRAFLLDHVVPDPALYADLTALGEAAVGISLLAGVLTPAGAAVGMALTLIYGLAVQHMSPGQLGFHVLLASLMATFFFTRAGRVWGVDGWLRARFPASLLTRWLT